MRSRVAAARAVSRAPSLLTGVSTTAASLPHRQGENACPGGPWQQMSNGLSIPAPFPPTRHVTEATIPMKAIVVTDQTAGTAGMTLAEPPEPPAAINDVVVQVHAS